MAHFAGDTISPYVFIPCEIGTPSLWLPHLETSVLSFWTLKANQEKPHQSRSSTKDLVLHPIIPTPQVRPGIRRGATLFLPQDRRSTCPRLSQHRRMDFTSPCVPAKEWLNLLTDVIREADEKVSDELDAIDADKSKTDDEKSDACLEPYQRMLDACHVRGNIDPMRSAKKFEQEGEQYSILECSRSLSKAPCSRSTLPLPQRASLTQRGNAKSWKTHVSITWPSLPWRTASRRC